MARKRQPHERKLRTREHVIADLSINYVERHIYLRGFAVSRISSDYGIDLLMFTYNDRGEIENGHVLFQVKATDALHLIQEGQTVAFRIEVADLKSWQDEWMPVILVIYDGQKSKAYWIHVQQYLDEKNIRDEDLSIDQDRVTLRVPTKNRLNKAAVEKFRQFRDKSARAHERRDSW